MLCPSTRPASAGRADDCSTGTRAPASYLQLDSKLDRTHLVTSDSGREVYDALRGEIAVLVEERHPRVVAGDDVVESGLELIAVAAVVGIDLRETYVRLKRSGTDLVRQQIERSPGERLAIEHAEVIRVGVRRDVVVEIEILGVALERDHACAAELLLEEAINAHAKKIALVKARAGAVLLILQ